MTTGSRVPVSAVLITRNAAAQLEACLASLAFAGEILVVDSGSDDGTLEIAARQLPGATIDWVVEEAFAGVAAMQRAVRRVIPLEKFAQHRSNRLSFLDRQSYAG